MRSSRSPTASHASPAVAGAVPRWLSLAMILEEGFAVPTLERILDSAATAAREAGVAIACGDTKVVPRGEVDEIYVTTSGVGTIRAGREPGFRRVRPGDVYFAERGEHDTKGGSAYRNTDEDSASQIQC